MLCVSIPIVWEKYLTLVEGFFYFLHMRMQCLHVLMFYSHLVIMSFYSLLLSKVVKPRIAVLQHACIIVRERFNHLRSTSARWVDSRVEEGVLPPTPILRFSSALLVHLQPNPGVILKCLYHILLLNNTSSMVLFYGPFAIYWNIVSANHLEDVQCILRE